MTIRRPRRQHGFTLLETLTALAIVALFLGAALPDSILDRLEQDRLRATALVVARSTLERYAATALFDEGTFTGQQGAFRWKARIEPTPSGSSSQQAYSLSLRAIRVEVFATGPQPLVSVTTYRMGQIR